MERVNRERETWCLGSRSSDGDWKVNESKDGMMTQVQSPESSKQVYSIANKQPRATFAPQTDSGVG